MAFTAQCLLNISNEAPPYNKPCSDSWCTEIEEPLASHCTNNGLTRDTAVIEKEPKKGWCYCCCSCFAWDTPIEKSPGSFVLAKDIQTDDVILAAGKSLNWQPRRVSYSSGIGGDGLIPGMYLVRYEYIHKEETERDIKVTADHLFLVEDANGDSLKAVQKLQTGDRIRRADGELSSVIFVVPGEQSSGTQSVQMEGAFDGVNLDGHLLNANGIVSADYAVQVYFSTDNLSAKLLHSSLLNADLPDAGTPEYMKVNGSPALEQFMGNPESWPKGFAPFHRHEITPPLHAHRFLTHAQANDIRRNAPRNPIGNTFPAVALMYVENLANGLYPGAFTFMLDWENEEPNAYSWNAWGRQVVVFTGGLLRVVGLNRDGISFILATMLSYVNPTVHCVGSADYDGISNVLRKIWSGNLYAQVAMQGFEQMTMLFSFVSPEHSAGNPKNICAKPSLECRLDVYDAAMSMRPIPRCAVPPPDYFEVVRADVAPGLKTVNVTFNWSVDVPTAETILNYVTLPALTITSAKVAAKNDREVTLEVTGLSPATEYKLTVANVVSEELKALNPKRSSVLFRTL